MVLNHINTTNQQEAFVSSGPTKVLCSHKCPQTNKGVTGTFISVGLTGMLYFPNDPGLYFPHLVWLILKYTLTGFVFMGPLPSVKEKRGDTELESRAMQMQFLS